MFLKKSPRKNAKFSFEPDMDQAELYSKNKSLQRTDAIYAIDTFIPLLNWRCHERILDVGCGDGEVSVELVLPKLPGNFAKLVGVDSSEKMISFAKARYHAKKNVEFHQLNICDQRVPAELQGSFDHIFSFYCLHWVSDQRRAFRNLHQLLKPTGEMLLVFLARNPIYDIFETISKQPRWSSLMKGVDKFISPYHHSKNPLEDIESFLRKEEFSIRLCKLESRCFTFPNLSLLKRSVAAVNPFKFSKDDMRKFEHEYLIQLDKNKDVIVEKCNNNIEQIHCNYKIFVIIAGRKS